MSGEPHHRPPIRLVHSPSMEAEAHAPSSPRALARDDAPAFRPIIDLKEVYSEMVRAEIRNGRLSESRRRRIVQYAAQLHLSAREAGRLIEECREELAGAGDPVALHLAPGLIESPPSGMSPASKFGLIVGAAVIINLLVCWLTAP